MCAGHARAPVACFRAKAVQNSEGVLRVSGPIFDGRVSPEKAGSGTGGGRALGEVFRQRLFSRRFPDARALCFFFQKGGRRCILPDFAPLRGPGDRKPECASLSAFKARPLVRSEYDKGRETRLSRPRPHECTVSCTIPQFSLLSLRHQYFCVFLRSPDGTR